ncbi:hypothetical protein I2I05_00445 [Hymenobacter sp. BT683]|uniref:DUF4168 domain-containing protein n=1 Tax=Hymenobacter jeongseonensis TaxID=2791027 RepID=A0ABS0ID05_9BACT|nr:hypothetical protein [Hymenobacter jeongseonensis]MBF9235853.1 hypothetical protein [Hymenobacter jeongseonensis]
MFTKGLLLLAMVMISGASTGQARPRPRAVSVAAADARGEKATPSFAVQVREAHRISGYLTDALVLTSAQMHAVEDCTIAECEALALAVTPADAAQARQQYLLALGRTLAPSQLDAYVAIREQLAGTLMPLDGMGLASR